MTLGIIGAYLTKLVVGKISDISIKTILERLKNPEYYKYRGCFNPPFVNAFKNTLNIFYDNKTTPYRISKELYDNLYKLDDVALAVIFQKVDAINIPFENNEIYIVLAEQLKEYNKRNNFELNDDFYQFWRQIFEEEYNRCFKSFLSSDNEFYSEILTNLFSLSIGAIEQLKNSQEIIIDKVDDYGKKIINDTSEIKTNIKEINAKLNTILDNDTFEDQELKKLQKLIDSCEYEKCIDYFELNKNDNWKNKSDDFKSKAYNKLGICYQNLNDYINAKTSYNTAYSLDNTYDNPLYNLSNILIDEKNKKELDFYLEKFNNKDSVLYKRLIFLRNITFENNSKETLQYLEDNKDILEDYYFLKGLWYLKYPQHDDYDTKDAEIAFEEYIKNCSKDTSIAEYNLLNCRFNTIINKSQLRFLFDIKLNGQLSIIPNQNIIEDKEEKEKLLNDLNELLSKLTKTCKNNFDLILNIKVKKLITEYLLNRFNQENININEINAAIDSLKQDESSLIQIMILNILCNKFSEAHSIYDLLCNETKIQSKNNFIIILFGEQKYSELLKYLDDEKVNNDINEQFKLIALYKSRTWSETEKYIKINLKNYNEQLLILCSLFYHEENSYTEECKILIKVAKNILNRINDYDNNFVYKIFYNLAFFKTDKEAETIRKNLVQKYWNNNNSKENFNIGLAYAIDLFNDGKYSECLSNLDILNQYEPNNKIIKNLYAQIDSINYNLDTIIKNYENGVKEERLLPLVAKAYINKRKFKKAKTIIDSLKFLDNQKQNYYYLTYELLIAQKKKDEIILKHLEVGIEELPNDIQLNYIIFNFLLKCHLVNDTTRKIFKQCSEILNKNKVIYQFNFDINNPIESLQGMMEQIEPMEDYLGREQFYQESLNNYNKGIYPLSMIAELFQTSSCEIIANFINNRDQEKFISSKTEKEYLSEINYLKKNKKVILSLETLILLKTLGIENLIFDNLKIGITVETLNEINSVLSFPIEEHTMKLVRDKFGKPELIKVKNNVFDYVEFLKHCTKHIRIINFKSNFSKANYLIQAAEKIHTKKFFFDSIVAVQNNCFVCSSDMVMQKINEQFKVKDISIISIIQYLLDINIINKNEKSLIFYKLIDLNCKYVTVNSSDLYYMLLEKPKNFYNIMKNFDTKYDKESIADVFSELIFKLDQNRHLFENEIYKVINYIFEWFNQLYPKSILVKLLMKYIMRYHDLLSDLTQKCIAQNFILYVYDKQYIQIYYETIISILAQKDYQNSQKNIQEISRISYNVPTNIRNDINIYANTLIRFGQFNIIK